MLSWFKKKSPNGKQKQDGPLFVDMDGQPLREGDLVQALRYDLGLCKIIHSADGWEYESTETGNRISYVRMIDATTKHQKVRKIDR
ncbi:MAG: hypothetical protein NWR72_20385 [Bacteroidia bacterium]|nr:hypothetical protein [Bacteroidia bacterium]